MFEGQVTFFFVSLNEYFEEQVPITPVWFSEERDRFSLCKKVKLRGFFGPLLSKTPLIVPDNF